MLKRNYKIIILILCMLLVSIIILFANQRWAVDPFLNSLFMTIGVSGITTGIFSAISLIIDKQNVLQVLENNFAILSKCHNYGLTNIVCEFPMKEKDIQKDFLNSKEVFILMNDGKNFISSNEIVKKRFEAKDKTTNIILLDYDQEDTMSVLTRKNGHDSNPMYYKNKIKDVIDYHFSIVEKNEKHKINVYLNSNYNTMAIILMDNYAMISLFRVSSGKDVVPHMIFEKNGSEYDKIRNDVLSVCRNAKKIDVIEKT